MPEGFFNVSFYVHGLISFGTLTGGMIATSGDEAFVMLALFPKQALLLFAPSSWGWKRITFAVLFVVSLGIIATVPEHFLREHIWNILLKNIC